MRRTQDQSEMTDAVLWSCFVMSLFVWIVFPLRNFSKGVPRLTRVPCFFVGHTSILIEIDRRSFYRVTSRYRVHLAPLVQRGCTPIKGSYFLVFTTVSQWKFAFANYLLNRLIMNFERRGGLANGNHTRYATCALPSRSSEESLSLVSDPVPL